MRVDKDTEHTKLQKYCDEREFELFFLEDEPYISAFGMVKYTNHKNSQDMINDFISKKQNWLDNPTVISHEITNDNGDMMTHYLIPFDQAISFLKMYRMHGPLCDDVNLVELETKSKYERKEKKFKITQIVLKDWLEKYNIEYLINQGRLYVFPDSLMKYTKSKDSTSMWNKLDNLKIISGSVMVRIDDAIKCLKKIDVIDEFPSITTFIELEIDNKTDKPVPLFNVMSIKKIDDILTISISIEEDVKNDNKRIVHNV